MKTPVAAASWPDQADTFLRLIDSYRNKNMFCDCTLACDRKFFPAHKMVLSMCSEFFEKILSTTSDKNPVIILNGVEAWQLECLLNYMYRGETSVPDTHFSSLCRTAKCLQIKGFDMVELHRKAVKLSKQIESRQLEKALSETGAAHGFRKMISVPMYRSDGDSGPLSPEDDCPKHDYRDLDEPPYEYPSEHSNENLYSKDARRDLRSHPEYPTVPYRRNRSCSPWLKYEDIQRSPAIPLSHETPIRPPIVLREHHSPIVPRVSITPSSTSRTESPRKHQLSELPAAPQEPRQQTLRTQSPEVQRVTSPLTDEISKTVKPRHSPTHPREPPPLLKLNDDGAIPKRKFFEDLGLLDSPKRFASDQWFSTASKVVPSLQKVKSPGSESSKSEPYGDTPSKAELIPVKRSPSLESPMNLSGRRSESPEADDPLLKKIHTNKRKRVRGPKSWEFLLRLLNDPNSNPSLIRWEDEEDGIFRLIQPDVIAQRWGRRTGKQGSEILSYESFARGLRYHYQTKALNAVSEKTYVYQFGPKARGMSLPSDPNLVTEVT